MTAFLLSLPRRRLLGIAAVSAVIALAAAVLNSGYTGPFGSGPSRLQVATATTNLMVDLPAPSITERRTTWQDVNLLTKRAELLSRLLVSPPLLERIAERAKVPADELTGIARTTAFVPDQLTEPASEERASQIWRASKPYRIEVQSRPVAPLIDLYVQARTPEQAERIADAAVPALTDHMTALARKQGVAAGPPVVVRQLGAPRTGIANPGAPFTIAVLTFGLAFALCAGLLLLVAYLRARPARPAATVHSDTIDDDLPADDAWPHTGRMLPWMVAAFITLVWLVPFGSIELNVSFPIDLKPDRIILPFIVGTWALAVLAGGRMAPRLSLTPIHAAMAGFLAFAMVGVVVDAHFLNQTLAFDLSLKKLPLLFSYMTLFVLTASVVRRTEVKAFLTYTLVLAVICALGMIWEFRFEQNLFYDWSDKLLPAAFTVTADSASTLDSLGRRMVRGSAAVPLEAVAMLTMALPIALVGLMHAERRAKLAYAFAVAALLAAMLATYRKSALLAPVAVVLTLAYFRRRELLKLAPLGMVLLIVVSTLSPGALRSTLAQFTREDASAVPTVSDRTSDYDAVRPDVWSHLLFGRGWGSYDHNDFRILDSEILNRTVEQGILGPVVFVLLGVAVILSARGTIASRDPRLAPAALVGAAAAVGFLVVSTLYDVMAFPHVPYLFFFIAGLVAVVLRRDRRIPDPPPAAVRAPALEPAPPPPAPVHVA